MISMAIYMKADRAITGIILGGSIMFFTGLVDDLIDIKPPVKLFFEVVAALVLIYYGVQVDRIRLPFGLTIDFD